MLVKLPGAAAVALVLRGPHDALEASTQQHSGSQNCKGPKGIPRYTCLIIIARIHNSQSRNNNCGADWHHDQKYQRLHVDYIA